MRSLPIVALLALAANAAAQATRWVSPTGSNSNPGTFALPLQTINHANAIATNGDVIRLHAGVFGDEQGVIVLGNKNVAVIGSGVGATVVRAHSTLTTNINTGFPASPVATQQRAVLLVQGSARVDVRNLTIDGNFAVPASGRLTGLYFRDGADGLVSDVEIKNCRANPLNGLQGPAGVVVRGDDGGGDTCRVTLRNCTLTDWGKVGAAAFFDATLRIEDCRVRGADHVGAGGPAQVGVQIAYDAGGAVHRTTVSDIFYDPAGTVATGILCYDADNTVVIEDNAVANCEQAIYLFGSSNTSLAASVRRNRVVACGAGVWLDNLGGVTVADNHLQLSLDLTGNAAFSNAAGNTWSRNNYSSWSGVGSYAIPGGGNVDSAPRRGVDLFGAPVATALPVGHAGKALAVGQLDGAGGSDFATVDENGGLSLTVGLNTGGAFAVSSVPFAATGQPVAVVAAELNNAPGVDLAVLVKVTGPLGARVYTFANNGSGAFAQIGNHLLAGVDPTSLSAGDVTGDAIADLAVGDGDAAGDAVLMLNKAPHGTNYVASSVPSAGFYTAAVRGVALVDLTGDGNRDLVVAEGGVGTGNVHVFAGNGAGAFAATGFSPIAVTSDATQVAVGDLDGDGDRDLLVGSGTAANGTPGGMRVLENLGGGTFRHSAYATERCTSPIAIGNVDSDSDPDSTFGDAVFGNAAGTVNVLGAFRSGAGFSHGGAAASGTLTGGAAFGDFNGDGYGDLFYTDGVGGQVLVRPGQPSARVDYYGYGTEGFHAQVPHVAPIGAPGVATQPNLGLGLQVSNCRTFTLAAIIGSLAPAAVLAPNDLQVDVGLTLLTAFAVTDFEGKFQISFALPATPAIRGVAVYFQGGVFDSIGGYVGFPGIALSNGMKLRVGH